MEIKPRESDWEKVAGDYTPELLPFEVGLAGEIVQILGDAGFPPPLRLLEAGCGSGHLSVLLRQAGYETDLLDFADKALESARKAFKARFGDEADRSKFLPGDILKLAEATRGREYDIVWNSGVLEHFSREALRRALGEMKAASGRAVLFVVPNPASLIYLVYRAKMLQRNRWDVGVEFLREDYAQVAEEAGLQVDATGTCGKEFTLNVLAHAVENPSDRDLFAQMVRGGQAPGQLMCLQYFLCTPSAAGAAGRKPPAKDSPRELDKTFYMDALGVASATILRLSLAEKERDEANRRLSLAEKERDEANRRLSLAEKERDEVKASAKGKEEQLDVVRSAAVGLVGAVENLKTTKSLRLTRWLMLLRRSMFHGTMRERLRFLGRSMKKVFGSREPLSAMNPLDVPLNEAYRIVSTVGGVSAGSLEAAAVSGVESHAGAQGLGVQLPRKAADPTVVNIVTVLFMDMDGKELLCGGGERYLLELSGLIREQGCRPVIHQAGHQSWERDYQGVHVVGVDVGGDIHNLNERFHRLTAPGALTIYSSFSSAAPFYHSNNLGISHGVFWDHKWFQDASNSHGRQWMSLIAAAIRNCSHIVSVDTNTINWVRSTMAEEAGKFTYVPNFVDTKEFRPRESGPAKEGKVVILYPRRLYAPRGFWLVEKLVPYILKKYPQAEFRFVGKADEEEAKAVRKMESQHGSRVQWQCLEPQEMSGAYREADITLCPTLSSEGTSLSCLEAMASGNAVIATNVGGLPELVTDGHNGLLVAPVLEELKDAIERLIQDAELRARLGQNARQVSLAYSKEIWEARWRKVLRAVLPPPPGGWDPVRTGYEFIHLDAGGVVWDRMKQRPHHLFRALAQAGQKGYFVNDEGRADTPDPMLGLKVVGREDRLPVDRPILYIYLSTNYEKIKNFRNPVVLYDILDDPKIHEEADRGSPPEASCAYYHEKLLAEAEIVMTSSRVLYERYRRARPDILLVPNGVWPEDFRVEKGPRPEDLPPVGKALIGYYGAVAGWFDFKLVGYASEAWPDCQFVLIGLTDRKAEVEAFTASHPNVFYLGEKRYEELPQYLAHFDAAILPFVVNEVTNAVCPVKLFEYAAGGKPVVSTGFREVRQYPGVFVAENKKEFVTKLEEALKARDDAGYRQQLARLAEENTWPERAGRILAELDRRLGDSGAASHERT